jgi:hypothetical protein
LSTLKAKNLTYTDLKPTNILISDLQAFLIDLESVMAPNQYNFVFTPGYFPSRLSFPFNTDRVLTFTFCMSIYVALCDMYVPPPHPTSDSGTAVGDFYKNKCKNYNSLSAELVKLLIPCLGGHTNEHNKPFMFIDLMSSKLFMSNRKDVSSSNHIHRSEFY